MIKEKVTEALVMAEEKKLTGIGVGVVVGVGVSVGTGVSVGSIVGVDFLTGFFVGVGVGELVCVDGVEEGCGVGVLVKLGVGEIVLVGRGV
jgi:hypothetical protein